MQINTVIAHGLKGLKVLTAMFFLLEVFVIGDDSISQLDHQTALLSVGLCNSGGKKQESVIMMTW